MIGRVRAEAGWSARFAMMTLLSAGIAILGLLQSSPAVVIGAMLISPLMGPIVGAGFALATLDTAEIRRTLLTLVAGTLLGVGLCALIVLLSPIQIVTSEIAARTRPNLFDLLIALFAGLAGTYATVRGQQGAIVGVAIATALMPPLGVIGFGVATANWAVLSGSLLLFFTNLMTIASAAAVLARLYGFATDLSPHQTRLQLIIVAGALAALAVPLGISLKKIAWEAVATGEAKSAVKAAFGAQARVSDLDINFRSTPLQISATVLTPKYRQGAEQVVTRSLQPTLGEAVAVTIDQVRTSDGDTTAVDLVKAPTAPVHPPGSRVAQELAILAGVSPDQVLVDAQHKIVEVKSAPVPGSDLASYRELERRIGAAESDWTVRLIPPMLPLPAISDEETRAASLDTVIWAAQRLSLPVLVSGSGDDADAVEKTLRSAGLSVQRSKAGPLAVSWWAPEASGH